MKITKQKIFLSFSVIAVIVLAVLFLNNVKELRFVQDDAFTVFRYAKNFLAGKGLVFNEGERVEGYTSFLWLMFLIIGGLKYSLPSFAQMLSVALGGGLLFLMPFFLKEIIGSKIELKVSDIFFYLLPSFILIFNADFIYWTVSGMETSLYLLFFLATIIAEFKGGKLLPVFVAVLTLVRPEGFLLFFVIEIHRFVYNLFNKREIEIGIILKEILIYLLLVVPLFVFRFVYYGNLLPNTFYAKTGFDFYHIKRGIEYFLKFFGSPVALLFVALPWFYFSAKSFLKQYKISLAVTVIFSFTVYNVLIGGDVLPMGRFFLPVLLCSLPLFTLSLFEFYRFLIVKKTSKYLIPLLGVLLVAFIIGDFARESRFAQDWLGFENGLVLKMKEYGRWIKHRQKLSGKKYTVATSTIGAISYYSNARVIDLIGLTDAYIAHHPKQLKGIDERISVKWRERNYNADYVLRQKPDFILFPAGLKPSAYAEAAIFSSAEFLNNYFVKLIASEKLGQFLPVYARVPDSLKKFQPVFPKGEFVKATESFILANNNLLAFLKYRKKKYFVSVCRYADSLQSYSPASKYLALNLKGMAEYHSGNVKRAKDFFNSAIKENYLNTVPLPYLIKIYEREGRKEKATEYFLRLRKLSD